MSSMNILKLAIWRVLIKNLNVELDLFINRGYNFKSYPYDWEVNIC